MCLAHLHPKTNICAKFHENRSKTEEVVRDARLRPTDQRHADSYNTPLYTTFMRGIIRPKKKKFMLPSPDQNLKIGSVGRDFFFFFLFFLFFLRTVRESSFPIFFF